MAKSYRFGYSGLIVVVRGHEELFFEFALPEKRNNILQAIEHRLTSFRQDLAQDVQDRVQTQDEIHARALKDLEASVKPSIFPSSVLDETPPVMFSSSSSSFVTFRLSEPLHSKYRVWQHSAHILKSLWPYSYLFDSGISRGCPALYRSLQRSHGGWT